MRLCLKNQVAMNITLRQVMTSNEHNVKKGCNKPYFPKPLCCLRTVIVITVDMSECINLISQASK